jgi:hypothetical protein
MAKAPIVLLFMSVFISLEARADGSFSEAFPLIKAGSEVAIQQRRTYGVADMLRNLKSNRLFAPLFEHYTLVNDSFSIQEGTPLAPRTLQFGNTARFITTFNKAHAKGGHALEISDFDFAANNILFREVIAKDDLPEGPKSKLNGQYLKNVSEEWLDHEFDLKRSEIEFENDKIAVTTPNPGKCLNCHALFPNETRWTRYIWSSYGNWPNMYGKIDDVLDPNEQKLLAEFKTQLGDRYSQLEGITKENAPYVTARSNRTVDTPNLQLTMYFSILQAKVLAQYVMEHQTLENLQRFSYQADCYLGYANLDVVKPLLGRNDYNLEATMSFDRQTLTVRAPGFHTGYEPLFGSLSLRSYVQQEIYFTLNPKTADEMIQQNRPMGSGYSEKTGLSEESLSFLKTRLNANRPTNLDLGAHYLLEVPLSYALDCTPARAIPPSKGRSGRTR